MSRLPLAATVAAAVAFGSAAAPSVSDAAWKIGMGDQNAAMFDSPEYKSIGIKRVRYIVPWDVLKHPNQLGEVDLFVRKAAESGTELLVSFNAPRGCWTGSTYKKTAACRLPTVARYTTAFKKFKARYPSVKVYSPWNEINHKSQPTVKNPRRAAQFYDAVRRNCRGCKIVAADVLDSSNVDDYLKDFLRATKSKPRLFGLHNYADVNRRRSSATRKVLRTVPGEVWLTETGGLVSFEPNFPYSPSRAASRTKQMFSLANQFDTRKRGYKSRVTRVYNYQWFGVQRGARFDAGLVDPDGTPRPALAVFKQLAAKVSK